MKDEKQKKEKVEWDKRKIFLTVLLFFLALFVVFEILSLDKNEKSSQNFVTQNVKGTSTLSSSGNGIKNSIQENINSIKSQAESINVAEIASSSPQVQKLIRDLKALQNYPSSGLKDACFKICSGL